jgi:hypothetical protein
MVNIISHKFFFNIALHITILFTILSWFFLLYIRKISADAINGEIVSLINNSFDSLKQKKIINKKLDEYTRKFNNMLHKMKIDPTDTKLINQLVYVNNDDRNIKKLKQLYIEISTIEFLLNDNSSDIINILNYNLTNTNSNTKNSLFDYYIQLLSKEDSTRKLVNEEISDKIMFTNALIIGFFILYTFSLYSTNSLNIHDITEVAIENIITFIFVGIIEVAFFIKIIFNYVPTPPSLIITSLIENIKNDL